MIDSFYDETRQVADELAAKLTKPGEIVTDVQAIKCLTLATLIQTKVLTDIAETINGMSLSQ